MSQRFYVYPALFLAAMQLAPLLRRDRRWYLAQIFQHALILLAALGAMAFENDFVWVVLTWLFFTGFVLVPRLLVRVALEKQQPGWWRWAGWFTWGELGRLFRRYDHALRLWRGDHRAEALAVLDAAVAGTMPEPVRGDVRVFQLRLLVAGGDWSEAIEFYRRAEDWGTLSSATRARLLVARALVRVGDFEHAFRCLRLAALSPRTLGNLERQYWRTRQEVLAAAPYGAAILQEAEAHSAPWRALMQWRRPAPVTLALLAACALVWATDEVFFTHVLGHPLWLVAGNEPVAVRHGEWWRPVSALFLHANLLHLTMNGAALWMFGTAVERTFGRWRFVVIFFLAGGIANSLSAWTVRYDVSVGASGGIFGVVAAFAVAVYRLQSPIYATVRRRLLLMLGLMLAADLTVGGLEPQVDNFAHGAGFAVGLLLALALWPRRISGKT